MRQFLLHSELDSDSELITARNLPAAQKNNSCKCQSFRSSRYLEITCPSCTWRSGSAVQGVRGGSQHASCRWCVVLELRFHTGRPRRDTQTGHMLKVWCWPRSVRRRSWPWHRNPLYQALNRAMGLGAVGSLATPLLVVRCQPNVTCAHMGSSVWLLLPRRDRFSSNRGVFALRVDVFVLTVRNVSLSLSRSLVLPPSFLIACLRPFSPACHRRGRRHRRSCASLTVTPWSMSLTCPLHNFKRICLRVQLVSQRTYFFAHRRANHEQIVENLNQSDLPGAHAAMHSGADRVHARSTVRGSNR